MCVSKFNYNEILQLNCKICIVVTSIVVPRQVSGLVLINKKQYKPLFQILSV